jgi:hypothetical protein
MNELQRLDSLFETIAGLLLPEMGYIMGDMVTVGDALRSSLTLPALILEPADVQMNAESKPFSLQTAFVVLVKRVPGVEQEKNTYNLAYDIAKQVCVRAPKLAKTAGFPLNIKFSYRLEQVDPSFNDDCIGYRCEFAAEVGSVLCEDPDFWSDLVQES